MSVYPSTHLEPFFDDLRSLVHEHGWQVMAPLMYELLAPPYEEYFTHEEWTSYLMLESPAEPERNGRDPFSAVYEHKTGRRPYPDSERIEVNWNFETYTLLSLQRLFPASTLVYCGQTIALHCLSRIPLHLKCQAYAQRNMGIRRQMMLAMGLYVPGSN